MNNSLRNEINAIFTSPEDSELGLHLKERNVLTKEVVVSSGALDIYNSKYIMFKEKNNIDDSKGIELNEDNFLKLKDLGILRYFNLIDGRLFFDLVNKVSPCLKIDGVDLRDAFLESWKTDNSTKNVIITHSKCNDGLGCVAAAVAYSYCNAIPLPEDIYCKYGEYDFNEIKNICKGRNVLITDFSFPITEFLELREIANKVFVVDHHVSTVKKIGMYSNVFVDTTVSGAVLTYSFFFGHTVRVPFALELISDRDVWHLLHGIKTNAYMYMLLDVGAVKGLDVYVGVDEKDNDNKDYKLLNYLESNNKYVERVNKEAQHAKSWVTKSRHIKYKHCLMRSVNITEPVSDILNLISKEYNVPAMGWEVKPVKVVKDNINVEEMCFNFSFRNYKDNISVEEIATTLAGGGHPQASGALVNVNSINVTALIKHDTLIAHYVTDTLDLAIFNYLYKKADAILHGEPESKNFTINYNPKDKEYATNLRLYISKVLDTVSEKPSYTDICSNVLDTILRAMPELKNNIVITKDNANILHVKFM